MDLFRRLCCLSLVVDGFRLYVFPCRVLLRVLCAEVSGWSWGSVVWPVLPGLRLIFGVAYVAF
jgi:hypothetical protein